MRNHPRDDSLRCSFCRRSQDAVGKLISSASNSPRVYICDECIAICTSLLPPPPPEPETHLEVHPLMHHPLASQFCSAVEKWLVNESLGLNPAREISEMRSLAARMIVPSEE